MFLTQKRQKIAFRGSIKYFEPAPLSVGSVEWRQTNNFLSPG